MGYKEEETILEFWGWLFFVNLMKIAFKASMKAAVTFIFLLKIQIDKKVIFFCEQFEFVNPN